MSAIYIDVYIYRNEGKLQFVIQRIHKKCDSLDIDRLTDYIYQ